MGVKKKGRDKLHGQKKTVGDFSVCPRLICVTSGHERAGQTPPKKPLKLKKKKPILVLRPGMTADPESISLAGSVNDSLSFVKYFYSPP